MDEPFALCPVHTDPSTAIRLAEVSPGHVIIAGRVEAVTEFYESAGMDFRDGPYIYARDERPEDHPLRMLIVSSIPGGNWPEEFDLR